MKDKMSVWIFSFRFSFLFLNVLMIGARYMADNMGERADPCPTPTLVANFCDVKLFHVYVVDLLE